MLSFRISSGAVLAMLAAPLMAQGTPAPPSTPRQRAVNTVEAPITANLNRKAEAITTARDDRRARRRADAAALRRQHAQDMAAYRRSVMAHRREVARDRARYGRQQQAFADAMAAWRVQSQQCRRGNRAACDAPTPNPADFY